MQKKPKRKADKELKFLNMHRNGTKFRFEYKTAKRTRKIELGNENSVRNFKE